jgi:hypothetical protein
VEKGKIVLTAVTVLHAVKDTASPGLISWRYIALWKRLPTFIAPPHLQLFVYKKIKRKANRKGG